MTIRIESTELDNGKTRRVAIDDEAASQTYELGLFAGLDSQTVAIWDVKEEGGVRKGLFLTVRPDLQGQGYLKKLAPHMAELLGDTPLEMVNVVRPQVNSLKEHLTQAGVVVGETRTF